MRPRRVPAYALPLYHPHDTGALSYVFIWMLAINLRTAVVRKDRMSVLCHVVNFHHLLFLICLFVCFVRVKLEHETLVDK